MRSISRRLSQAHDETDVTPQSIDDWRQEMHQVRERLWAAVEEDDQPTIGNLTVQLADLHRRILEAEGELLLVSRPAPKPIWTIMTG